MRIALVDDEPCALTLLSELLADELDKLNIKVELLASFSGGKEFFKDWHSGKYDVILLDMFMDELSGVDIAHKIRETDSEVRLVFCTTSNEFASESYSVNASYYLLKPATREGIKKMAEKINPDNIELLRYITLPDGQQLILRNIIFTEYFKHTVFVHTKNGGNMKIRLLQEEFERLISDFDFLLTCSKGIIVNLYEVKSLEKDVFVMTGGLYAPISRRKAKEAEAAYNSFLFDRLRGEMLK